MQDRMFTIRCSPAAPAERNGMSRIKTIMVLALVLVPPLGFAQMVPQVVPLSAHPKASPVTSVQAAVELGRRQAQELNSRALLQRLRLQDAKTDLQLNRLRQEQYIQALQQPAQQQVQQRLQERLRLQRQRQRQQAAQQTASCPDGAGQPVCP